MSSDDGHRDTDEEDEIGDEVFGQVILLAGVWHDEVIEKMHPHY